MADVSSIECHRLEIQGLVAPDKMLWRLKGRDKFSTPQKIPDKIDKIDKFALGNRRRALDYGVADS